MGATGSSAPRRVARASRRPAGSPLRRPRPPGARHSRRFGAGVGGRSGARRPPPPSAPASARSKPGSGHAPRPSPELLRAPSIVTVAVAVAGPSGPAYARSIRTWPVGPSHSSSRTAGRGAGLGRRQAVAHLHAGGHGQGGRQRRDHHHLHGHRCVAADPGFISPVSRLAARSATAASWRSSMTAGSPPPAGPGEQQLQDIPEVRHPRSVRPGWPARRSDGWGGHPPEPAHRRGVVTVGQDVARRRRRPRRRRCGHGTIRMSASP